MKSFSKLFTFLLCILITSNSWADIHLNLVGRVETGMLMDQNLLLDMKMDTGAKTASLSAHDIEIFKKGDQKWVRFIIDSTRVAKEYRFEYPLKRMVKIKKRQSEQAEGATAYERRPVIEMELCLGNEVQLIEISLTDRSNFIYPMLLGRSAMRQFDILIDPTAVRTTKPECKPKPTDNKEATDEKEDVDANKDNKDDTEEEE